MKRFFLTLLTVISFVTVYSQNVKPFKGNNGKWGLINDKAEIIVSPTFYKIWDFKDGFAIVEYSPTKRGFIKPSGELLNHTKYSDVHNFSDGMAAVFTFIDDKTSYIDDKTSYWSFIDTTGKSSISRQYSKITDFSEGLAAVKQAGSDNWTYINKKRGSCNCSMEVC